MASVKDISTAGIDLASCRTISHADFEKLERYGCRPRAGDVLLAKDGAKAAETACLIRDDPEVVLLSSVAILRPDPGRAEPAFLAYYLRSPRTIQYIRQGFMSGAAIPRIILEDIKRLRMPVPPLPVQRRIAALLLAYDELIENNLRRIEILEEMAQAVYEEWFVKFRFPGHEDVPLVDSRLGPVPSGWTARPIAELAGGNSGVIGGPFGSKLGRKDYVDSGVPVIRGTTLNGLLGWNDDEFVFVSIEKFRELRGNAATPGDIIVTQRGTLGQVGLVPASATWQDLVVSQSQMRIRVDATISTTLHVFHSLRWPATNKRLVDHAMTAGVPHINLGILREFQIVAPPLPVAAAYDERVGPMRKLAENLSEQATNLRSTRDLLVPKLVSGEIDVSALDIDTDWLAS